METEMNEDEQQHQKQPHQHQQQHAAYTRDAEDGATARVRPNNTTSIVLDTAKLKHALHKKNDR